MLNFSGEEISKDNKILLKKICKKTLKIIGQSSFILEVNLEFLRSDLMRELNNRTRKVNEPTDVLSFPNLSNIFNKKIKRKDFKEEINPENHKVMLGDIYINLDKASEQAQEFEHSLKREICYLFVHGLLHLLGYDHIDELDKNLMRGQEEFILSKFKLKRVWNG